jgi:small subunit ribosomal protein S20
VLWHRPPPRLLQAACTGSAFYLRSSLPIADLAYPKLLHLCTKEALQGLLFLIIGGNILMFDGREGGFLVLPNTKSAEKRVRQTEKRTARNRRMKSMVKTSIRRFEEAVHAGDAEAAKIKLLSATRQIDKAAAKGVIHKNTAARKKSQLTRTFNRTAAG